MQNISLEPQVVDQEATNFEQIGLGPADNTDIGTPRTLPLPSLPSSLGLGGEEMISKKVYLEKSKEMQTMTLKLKQFEFAIQEAIIFLSKPLNTYQEWIDSENTADDHTLNNNNLTESLLAAMSQPMPKGPTASSRASSVISSVAATPKAHPRIFSFSSAVSSNHCSADGGRKSDSAHRDQAMSDLEISCLENMRICFNFLRNCQKSTKAIDDGTYTIPKDSQLSNMDNESMALLLEPLTVTQQQDTLKVVKEEETNTPRISSVSAKSHASHKTSAQNINLSYPPISNKHTDFDQEGGDLSLEHLANFKPSQATTKCDKCRSTLLQLDTLRDTIKTQSAQINTLTAQLTKETQARKVVTQSKALMDAEIEEITAELFARANQMVVDESRRMDQLATNNRELTVRVSDLTSRLSEKESELSTATRALYKLQSHQPHTLTFDTPQPTESSFYIVSGFDHFKSNTAADGFVFAEFTDLIKCMVLSSSLPSLQAYAAIHATAFMKRCMAESVEPCLTYTYSSTKQSLSFRKKMLDMATKGNITITPRQEEKTRCWACAVSRVCEYTLAYPDKDGGSVCRFCRDRVLATQDFFMALARLATGPGHQTILTAFRQIMWTRRRMAVAVVGSCSLFETEVSAITGPGLGGNWEKATKTLY